MLTLLQEQPHLSTLRKIWNVHNRMRRHRNRTNNSHKRTIDSGTFRPRAFARVHIQTEDATEQPPHKRRNFTPSHRGKFTASTVPKGQRNDATMVAELRASTSTTSINNQTTVPPYTNVMEPQPEPSSEESVPSTPLLTGLLERKSPERYVLYNCKALLWTSKRCAYLKFRRHKDHLRQN